MDESQQIRAWFADTGQGFVELVQGIGPESFDGPGLGEWTVRDLIGHTCRAFSTVEAHLAAEVPDGASWVDNAAAYFTTVRRAAVDHGQIAERGREAGRALGAAPAAAVADMANRVLALVARSPDDAPVMTVAGPMMLIDYLPTRAFELTVHSLDLAVALGVAAPAGTRRSTRQALALVADLAEADDAAIAVRALTGRCGLPVGFSLL
ncbi:maleylpyruvate isomerase N-terminal domain-containing protein [Granulicoccus sp. GXG6511]|uniref:maleylpyruvate isomerase N-terminal domain-containing protein n=1 Tax=Granulicoccus sp. GXG6511 TaxID=3381351 RepID=UPI003D7D9968